MARARRMVPEGTFAVGAGLAVSGVTTYGFQILAFRGLSKPDYAALNALWVFVFVLAPGVFLPLEQEVGRALSARRVRGIGGGPVVRRAGMIGAAFSVALALGIIGLSATTGVVQHKFNGHIGLVVCLVVALCQANAAHAAFTDVADDFPVSQPAAQEGFPQHRFGDEVAGQVMGSQ